MRTITALLGIVAMTVAATRAATPAPSRPTPPDKLSKRLTLDHVTFPNRAQDKKDLTKWETWSSGIRDSNWEHTPWKYHDSIWERHYKTSWRNPGGDERKPGKLHLIELRAHPWSRDRNKISWIELDAKWRPDRGGWGADFHCDSTGRSQQNKNDPSVKRWFIYFRKYTAFKPQAIQTLGFFPGLLIYYDVRRYDGTTYDSYVAVGPAQNFGAGEATVKEWIASPDSLLQTGLAWLDQLEKEVEQRIRTGKAVRHAFRIEESAADGKARNRLGGMLQMSGFKTVDSERPLSDTEKEEMIRDALKKIAARKKLLRDHHREMHAALLKAFPLVDYLPAPKRP